MLPGKMPPDSCLVAHIVLHNHYKEMFLSLCNPGIAERNGQGGGLAVESGNNPVPVYLSPELPYAG